MPRSTCPDPALLQAYVDGTVFSRDVPAVEQHLASCERCAAIVAASREEREAARASTWSRPRVIGTAVVAILVGAIAAWAVWPPSAPAPAPAPASAPAPPPALAPAPAPAPKAAAPPPAKPSAPVVAERRQPVVKETAPAAEAKPPTEIASADGVVLRGTRRSNRSVVWRARDVVIEHSTDGGMTWTTEYRSDRSIRAGAFVSADVAWLVGDSGLVLRRTKNGWFGTTPPGEGNIKAIRASSSSKASVTFDNGRVFTTENGGVTWSSP